MERKRVLAKQDPTKSTNQCEVTTVVLCNIDYFNTRYFEEHKWPQLLHKIGFI